VVVLMEHTSKDGASKVLKRCTLPLTGKGVVNKIITDLCVFEIDRKGSGATLIELADGVTLDEVKSRTEARFKLGPGIG
jgi:3-oxoacid CoA-transferase subunit B